MSGPERGVKGTPEGLCPVPAEELTDPLAIAIREQVIRAGKFPPPPFQSKPTLTARDGAILVTVLYLFLFGLFYRGEQLCSPEVKRLGERAYYSRER